MLKLKYFDKTADNRDVYSVTLENSEGESVEILNYGATVKSLFVKDSSSVLRDVVLGYDNMKGYEENTSYFGAVIGRCANRLTGPSFTLNGNIYYLFDNTGSGVALHGGKIGFDKKIWNINLPEANPAAFEALKSGAEIMSPSDSVSLTLLSPDGEEGYPGNLTLTVKYTFTDDARLILEYKAQSDADTILNITNHSYFNLDGHDCGHDCLKTYVRISADKVTPLGKNLAPTGEFLSVAGTPYDFNEFKQIGQQINDDYPQLIVGSGYDINFALKKDPINAPVTECYSTESGICMRTYTDLPGVQFYTGNFIEPHTGKQGAQYGRRGAFCFETQLFPNGINVPEFDSPILKAGDVFESKTVYEFDTIG